jgi:hypothetical protein
MPVPLWKQTRTRADFKKLATSNMTPTTTIAAANELDNILLIRTELSGFDYRQSRYTRISIRTVSVKPLFKWCSEVLPLRKSVGAYS